jgi:uncharacterized membrane protein
MNDLGRRVYGLAAIWLGLVGLRFADFAAVWQPVPDGMPGRTLLAYACAVLFIVGGAAMQWRRTAQWASVGLAVLYLIFALLWSRRIVAMPQVFGVWSGTAEQLAMALGGVMAWAFLEGSGSDRAIRVAQIVRLGFGVCLVAFGFAHFLYPKETADLVPAYMPGGGRAWAYITGACHLMAGLALLSGVLALVAARLITAMFVVFGALVWAPQLFQHPEAHMAWAGNGVNLALVGAAWVVADGIARFTGMKRGGVVVEDGPHPDAAYLAEE